MKSALVGVALLGLCVSLFSPSEALGAAKQQKRPKVLTLIGIVKDSGEGSIRLKAPRREYKVVADTIGTKLGKELNGKRARVTAVRTGNVVYDMVMSMGSPVSGSGNAVQVPEIRVTNYRPVAAGGSRRARRR